MASWLETLEEQLANDTAPKTTLQSIKFGVMKLCLVVCFTAVRAFIWIFDHPRISVCVLALLIALAVAATMGVGLFAR